MAVVVGQLQPVVHRGQQRHLGEEIPARQARGRRGEAPRFNAVRVPENFLEPHRAGVADSHPGRVGAAGGVAADAGCPLRDDVSLQSEIQKERGAVTHDRSAQGEGELLGAEVLRPEAGRVPPRQRLVLEVAGERSRPAIRARVGHRVHQPAGEGAKPHVERRGEDLQLPQRLDREGAYPAARGRRTEAAAPRESGEIEVGGAVDLEAVEPVRLPGDGDTARRREHGLRGEVD